MSDKKIILSADGTCDIGDVLRERYDVNLINYKVTLDEKTYTDSVDITPDDLYDAFRRDGTLPKTSAINTAEYIEHFKKWTDEGYEVIHITLSSGITAGYQACMLAAEELPGVYVIDSRNISTGVALLVIEAGERIKNGMRAEKIAEEISALRDKSHCSFVLETLDFMRAGGRCSDIAAFAATLLNLKPCIEVNNETGKMYVSKKYRGSMDKVLLQYTKDRFEKYENIKRDWVFITHSGVPEERIELVKKYVQESGMFDEIFITRASCTISTHCGPGTLGVLFMTE